MVAENKAGELIKVDVTPAKISMSLEDAEIKIDRIEADLIQANEATDITDEAALLELKKERIAVDKIQKALTAKRKAITEELLKPMKPFEEKCLALERRLKDISAAVKETQNKGEMARKQKIEEELFSLYEKKIGELEGVVSYDALLEPGWLNKTTTKRTREMQLMQKIKRIKSDWEVLRKTVDPAYKGEAERVLFDSLSLSEALRAATVAKERDDAIKRARAVEEAPEQILRASVLEAEAATKRKADAAAVPRFDWIVEVKGASDAEMDIVLDAIDVIRSSGLHGTVKKTKAATAAD